VQLQLRDIFSRLTCAMERAGASLADAVFVHLYIASVGLFAAVNEEYCKWFGKQPPSRSCVIVSSYD
jgi:enamine deaminase RidA (YjgF/YER057c/UK114 family)